MEVDRRTELNRELPLRTGIRAVWLGLLVFAVASNVASFHGNRVFAALSGAAALVSAANVVYLRPVANWFRIASLVLLGVTGGLCGVVTAWAAVFLGIAGASGGTVLEAPLAAGIALIGPATLGIASLLDHRSSGLFLGGAAAAFAGLVIGISRRQGIERSEQLTAVTLEREKTAIERQRVELLDERNRLAREVHDVLAHTLGALSVQLEAADAILEADKAAPEAARAVVRRSRALVVDGLDEARAAVRALRDLPVDLAERVTRLGDDAGVAVTLHGPPRPLAPAAGGALLRAAQEGVTNARRHEPGALVEVEVTFAQDCATVRVSNGVATTSGAGGPPGFGLQGMRERVELAGGSVTAGPNGSGWTIEATVPG